MQNKLDISVIFKTLDSQETRFEAEEKSGLAKAYVERTLIPGCKTNVELLQDDTANVRIFTQDDKPLGHVVLIINKQENQRQPGYSNAVLKTLAEKEIKIEQLTNHDFALLEAEENLNTKLAGFNTTFNTTNNTLLKQMQDAFENARKRCVIQWSTLQNHRDKTTVNTDYGDIDPIKETQRYTEAFKAMSALLQNPLDINQCHILKGIAADVIGGNYYHKKPIGWIALTSLTLLLFVTGILFLPPYGSLMHFLLPLLQISIAPAPILVGGITAGFFGTLFSLMGFGNSISFRSHALQITGLYNAVEAVEAVQKEALSKQPDHSGKPRVGITDNNETAHPAGEPTQGPPVGGKKVHPDLQEETKKVENQYKQS